MTQNNIVVAIDGYSACGKSTVAKAAAKRLNFVYVDSGAMYRAVTLYFLENKVDIIDAEAVNTALANIRIDLKNEGDKQVVLLNDVDVSEEIREMRISQYVSQVSAIKEVRRALVEQQQQIARSKNIIMDGRDIGSVVFPDAQIKIFMTADPHVRAKRRYDELAKTNPQISMEEVFENLAHRDYEDTSREESPLIHLPEAITLDNSNLSEDEQLDFLLGKVNELAKENKEMREQVTPVLS